MPSIPWVKSYEAAVQSARASKKLIMIDFFTDWCHYCKKLDAEVYSDPKVVRFCAQVVGVKINAEKEGHLLASKYGVTGFPTILLIDSDGAVWGRLPGFLPSDKFIGFVGETLKTYREQPLLEAKLQQNPGDVTLAVDLTERFARQSNTKKALWAVGLVQKAPKKPLSARAYIAVGGLYLEAESLSSARSWFNRALTSAMEPREKALGHLGLAMCAATERNAKAARAELNTVLKIPGCPRNVQEKAHQMLDQIPQ